MTDTNRLKDIIKKSGYKYSYVAERLGLTYQGLKNKIENKTLFNTEEVDILCKILKINSLKDKESIFYVLNSDK